MDVAARDGAEQDDPARAELIGENPSRLRRRGEPALAQPAARAVALHLAPTEPAHVGFDVRHASTVACVRCARSPRPKEMRVWPIRARSRGTTWHYRLLRRPASTHLPLARALLRGCAEVTSMKSITTSILAADTARAAAASSATRRGRSSNRPSARHAAPASLVALTGCDATAENDLDGDAEPRRRCGRRGSGALPQKEVKETAQPGAGRHSRGRRGKWRWPLRVGRRDHIGDVRHDGTFASSVTIAARASSRFRAERGSSSFLPSAKLCGLSRQAATEARVGLRASTPGSRPSTAVRWEAARSLRAARCSTMPVEPRHRVDRPDLLRRIRRRSTAARPHTLAVTVDADATAMPEGEVEDVAWAACRWSWLARPSVRCGPGSADCDYDGGEAFLAGSRRRRRGSGSQHAPRAGQADPRRSAARSGRSCRRRSRRRRARAFRPPARPWASGAGGTTPRARQ